MPKVRLGGSAPIGNFKLKKSIFAKNPSAHFTLKISTNRRFETYSQVMTYYGLTYVRQIDDSIKMVDQGRSERLCSFYHEPLRT